MTDYLEQRLPENKREKLTQAINNLDSSEVNELENWLKSYEKKLDQRLELNRVKREERGFAANFKIGISFP